MKCAKLHKIRHCSTCQGDRTSQGILGMPHHFQGAASQQNDSLHTLCQGPGKTAPKSVVTQARVSVRSPMGRRCSWHVVLSKGHRAGGTAYMTIHYLANEDSPCRQMSATRSSSYRQKWGCSTIHDQPLTPTTLLTRYLSQPY